MKGKFSGESGGCVGKYTELFISETRKHVDALGRALASLPEGSAAAAALEEMGRMAHSIKGMALFEEQESIADLALALEQTCLGEVPPGAGIPLDPFREGVELLGKMIDEVARDGVCRSDPARVVADLAVGAESG
jgi:two-component system chemotaxis sensor kinase CheA